MLQFKQKIVGIMAVTAEGVIGKDNSLPWHYPEELEHFRRTADGHTIIMGRKTYDAIPNESFLKRDALKSKLIVFSKNTQIKDDPVTFVKSLDECIEVIRLGDKTEKIFMIGGASIAHLFLQNNLISHFIMTKIHHLYQGEVCLDLKYFKGWKEEIVVSHPNYTICYLTNTTNLSDTYCF